MSELYSSFLKYITLFQYELNRYISSSIRSLDDQNSLSISLSILGIAFIYGLVHAAGPGHGKALVAFYFTSNKTSYNNYKKAFKIGYMISVVHAFSALIITFGIFFLIKALFRQNFNNFSNITMIISSIMIILIGLYLIFDSYKQRKKKEQEIKTNNKSEYYLAFSAGIVPCPGVMTIVLFCIMLKQYILGILAAITMSIGMGLTISLAGIISIALNKKAGSFLDSKGYILEIFGGTLIVLLGVFLFLGAYNIK